MNMVAEPIGVDRVRSPLASTQEVLPKGASVTAPRVLPGLFQALAGLHNGRALAAMFGGMTTGMLLDGLLSTLGGHTGLWLSVLGGLAFFIAGATGVNAAGVLLVAQAKGIAPRGLQNAILFGLKCVPRLVVLWAALALLGILVVTAMALACFVCRMPWLGPVLLVAVFPLSVVVSGVAVCGLSLGMVLALPAIWEGASVTTAIARVLAIARTRLVESLLLLAAVFLMTLAVGCVVLGVVWTGLVPMLSASARIVGDGTVHGFTDLLDAYAGGTNHGSERFGAYATAMTLGTGLLGAFAGSLVSLVGLFGLNLVYLRVAAGIGHDSVEASPRTEPDPARQPVAEVAGLAAVRARDKAHSGPTKNTAFDPDTDPAVPHAATCRCPHCLSATQADDVFCGVCGYKLG